MAKNQEKMKVENYIELVKANWPFILYGWVFRISISLAYDMIMKILNIIIGGKVIDGKEKEKKVIDGQMTVKEFTGKMAKQCDVKIAALKDKPMETCKKMMSNIGATEVKCRARVLERVNIDSKKCFEDIVENLADILKLSEEEKKSIILSGSSESGNEMVLDFNGKFEKGGTVNIHVGGYAVTRRKTEDNKEGVFNLYVAISHIEMKNIHLLPKGAQQAIRNFGEEEDVTDAPMENEECQYLRMDHDVWKAFFQNSGYKELRDHLHVEN